MVGVFTVRAYVGLGKFVGRRFFRLGPVPLPPSKTTSLYYPLFSRVSAVDLMTTETTEGCLSMNHTVSVLDAVKAMCYNNTGAVAVLDDNDRVIGILTERDYVTKLIVKGKASKSTQLNEIMTKSPTCAHLTHNLDQVIQFLLFQKVRHIPVVHHNDQLLGMISVRDVIAKVHQFHLENYRVLPTVRQILVKRSARYGTSPITTINPKETVYSGIELMTETKSRILIVNEGDVTVGMFGERDYLRKVIVVDRASKTTRIEEIMTTNFHSVTSDHSIDQCLAIMTSKRFRHLPVFDHSDSSRCIGLVSVMDLLSCLYSD